MTRFALSLLVLGLAVQHVAADDFSNVKSGLLLGIYATPGNGGMRVSDTIPGYSAEGRLFPGDVLLRTTVDGFQIYRTRTHYEMENAKIAIGPNREAAVEFWRPGVGLIYAWVEFTPVGGPAATYSIQQPHKAQFKMESEKPGARRMFQQNGNLPDNNQDNGGFENGGFNNGGFDGGRPMPQPRPFPPFNGGNSGNPGDLFRPGSDIAP